MSRPQRAARLVDALLASGSISEETLAAELVMPVAALRRVRSGGVTLPVERLLCLVLLVEERFPALRRPAAALRAQVAATLALRAREREGGPRFVVPPQWTSVAHRPPRRGNW